MTDPDIPVLTIAQREGLLRRIGVSSPTIDITGLMEMVRGWITSVAFHNVDLLAASTSSCAPVLGRTTLERCVAGIGGTCHVHAFAFVALLSSLGFDASFAAATIRQPGDHLLARVVLGDEVFLCDVGNGQPYLEPWSASRATEVRHLGWRMLARPSDGMVELTRWSPDLPGGKTVYCASPEPRRWRDFSSVIELHHSQAGYGPFMTGLRAVRIAEARMDVLRDDQWTTYSTSGCVTRAVPDGALGELLTVVFALAGLPIEEALDAWRYTIGRRMSP